MSVTVVQLFFFIVLTATAAVAQESKNVVNIIYDRLRL